MPSSRMSSIIKEAIERARRIPPPSLGEASEVIVASCPGAEGYGAQYYLALRHSGVRAVRVSCVEASVHILPYSSGGEVCVAFTANPRDSHLMHLANAASALGVRVTAYGPQPHPAYSDTLAELGVDYRAVDDNTGLALLIAPLLWAPKPWKARRERLEEEIKSLPEAPGWLEEKYPEALRRLTTSSVDGVAYSPSTEPGALLLASSLGLRTYRLASIANLRGQRILAIYTSAEEHAYKQSFLAARVRGVDVVEVRLNTDPLTAPLYAALLGVVASGVD
jgi:hypothetical protein